MKNKLVSAVCVGLTVLTNNSFGQDENSESQFDEINTPVKSEKQQFSLSDLFSNLNIGKQQKTQKNVREKEKKDYFAEDFQAFEEDDPWDMQ